jgi:hypothetical protein
LISKFSFSSASNFENASFGVAKLSVFLGLSFNHVGHVFNFATTLGGFAAPLPMRLALPQTIDQLFFRVPLGMA